MAKDVPVPEMHCAAGARSDSQAGQLLLLTHALFHRVLQEVSLRYQRFQAPGNKDGQGRKPLSSESFHYSCRCGSQTSLLLGQTPVGNSFKVEGHLLTHGFRDLHHGSQKAERETGGEVG